MNRFRLSASWTLMFALAVVVLGVCLFSAAPASALEIETEFPFELDKWFTLDMQDGPVTLHRIRVVKQKSNVKSKIFRPSNSEFSETVQIQIEYTNESKRDFEAEVEVVWVDAEGREIDGYRDEEGIDEDERDEITMTFSTLRYGLDRAKTLQVKIEL